MDNQTMILITEFEMNIWMDLVRYVAVSSLLLFHTNQCSWKQFRLPIEVAEFTAQYTYTYEHIQMNNSILSLSINRKVLQRGTTKSKQQTKEIEKKDSKFRWNTKKKTNNNNAYTHTSNRYWVVVTQHSTTTSLT